MFDSQKSLIKKMVFIDGLPRSGKSSICNVITSLKNSESLEFCYTLEQLLPGIASRKININFAKAFINKHFDEIAYNKFLGRNSNFRPKDWTGIPNFSFPNIYKKRLKSKEGKKIIRDLKRTKNFFPFMSHNIMPNINYFYQLGLNSKIISLYRNPFSIVYSLFNKRVGNRTEKDSRVFTILERASNGRLYPWYVGKDYKKWFRFNEMEKSAFIVLKLLKLSIKKHKYFKKNKKILTISYEDYLLNTNQVLQRICNFIKTKKTPITPKFLRREKLPITGRKIIKIDNKRIKKIIKTKISKQLFKSLIELENKYSKNIYNLR